MAREARFTDAIPVYDTPEMRERIQKLAKEHRVSQAAVVRTLMNFSIGTVENLAATGNASWLE